MAQSLAFDSMHPAGKLPPTLTPTGHFAGKPTLPISRSVTLIGSRKQARLQLISSTVSHNHTLIVNADSGPYIRDLASREFTFVNGIQVREGPLSDGDEIQIGRFTFRFNESPHTQPVEAIRKIAPAPAARIEVEGADMPIEIEGKSLLIGRRDTCDIPLLEESVSTTHAIIFEMDGHRYIRDLASRKGTFINGKQVHQIELTPDDEIRIGETTMRYVSEAAAARPSLPAAPADMGVLHDDLVELESEAPPRPVPQPRAAGTPPKAVAIPTPAPAGAEALELVQDQPAETENVDLESVDLQAHPIPIEHEAPETEPAEGVEPEINLEPIAPIRPEAIESEPIDIEAALEPLEAAPGEAAAGEPLVGEPAAIESIAAEPIAEAAEEKTVELEPIAEEEPQEEFQATPTDELNIHGEVAAEGDDDALVDLLPESHESHADEAADVELEPLEIETAEDQASRIEAPASKSPEVEAPEAEAEEPAAEIAAESPAAETPSAESPAAEPALAEAPEIEAEAEPEPLVTADAEEDLALETIDELELAETNHEPVDASEAIDDVLGLESLPPLEPPPLPPSRLKPGMSQLHLEPVADIEVDSFREEPEPVAEALESTPTARPAPFISRLDDFKAPADPEPAEPLDFTGELEELPALDFDTPEAAALEEEIGISPTLAELAAETTPAAKRSEPAGDDQFAELPTLEETDVSNLSFGASAEADELPEDIFGSLEEASTALPPLDLGVAPDEGLPEFPEGLPDTDALDLGLESEPVPAAETPAEPAPETPPAAKPLVAEPVAEQPLEKTPVTDEALAEQPAEAETLTRGIATRGKKSAAKPAKPKKPPKRAPRRKPPASETTEAPRVVPTVAAGLAAAATEVPDLAEAAPPAPAPEVEPAPKFEAAIAPEPIAEAPPIVEEPAEESAASPIAELAMDEPVIELADAAEPVAEATPTIALPRSMPQPVAPQWQPKPELHLRPPAEPSTPEPALELRPPLEPIAPEPVERDVKIPDVEIIESTEATPESALDLDDDIAISPEESSGISEPQSVELTDTSFGRAVENFVGESTGPIVEQPTEPAAESIGEAPREAHEPESAEPVAREEEVELEPIAEAPQPISPEPVSASEPAHVSDDEALEMLELEPTAEATDGAPAEPETPVSLLPSATIPEADRFKDEPLEKLFHIAPLPKTPAPEEEVELELEPLAESAPETERSVEMDRPVTADETPKETPVDVQVPEHDVVAAEPVEPEPLIDDEAAVHPNVSAQATAHAQPEVEPHVETPVEVEAVEPKGDEPDLAALEALEPSAPHAEHKAPSATEEEPVELELDETPVAQAPAPPPPKVSAPGPIDPFNWGANQEHFLGGRPLQLNAAPPAPVAPIAQPIPPSIPRPAAERPAPAPQFEPTIQDRPMPVEPIGPSTPVAPPLATPAASPSLPRPMRGGATPAQRGKPAQVSTGFDGLALPPVRETDVFGQFIGGFENSGTADDVFGRRSAPTPSPLPSPVPNSPAPSAAPSPAAPNSAVPNPAADNVAASAATAPGAKRPPARRASKSEPSGDAWSPPADDATDSLAAAPPNHPASRPPEIPTAAPAPRKKRRWFGLKSLLIGMLACAAGAAGGIYYAVPNESTVLGRLHFANINALTQLQLNNLEADQRSILGALQPTLKAVGTSSFMGDPAAYPKLVSATALDRKTGVLTVPYVGGASSADQVSMLSLLKLLYDRNRPMVDEANELNRTVESLTRERAAAKKTIDEIAQKIEELDAAAQNRPDAAQRAKLESDAAQLEANYEAAKQTVKAISSELKQLQENPAGASAAPPPAPATNDAVIQQLQGELKQLNDRVSTVQDGRSEKAKEARAKLDAALTAFNQQIEQAQGAVKNNPDLVAYLGNAQKLMTSTRDLTDQLIKRQQDQYGKLSELKTSLNDKMLARRADVWKKDPELVKLMDQKDIKTRQYNAAVGQNLTKEADDMKAELSLLDSMIKARQTVVADDGFYADTIDQLQKIIDATQKGLEDDRKLTMQKLDELQTSFSRGQPPGENLTPEQKQLAAEMDKRLQDVSAARRQYTEAAATANKQADEEMRTLQANASELSSKVQARKKELGDATTAAEAVAPAPAPPAEKNRLVEQKTAELAAAEKVRADAEAASNAADKKLRDLKARIDDARAAGEKHDALVRQKDIAQRNLDQLINQYDLKKKLAEQKAYPVAPTESDVTRDPKPDKRPVYTLAAMGAIMGVFVCLALMTGAGRDEEPPVAPAYATDEFEFLPPGGDPDATMEHPVDRPTHVEV